MGKNNNWFVAVKKTFNPEPKEKKHEKTGKSRWMCRGSRRSRSDSSSSDEEPVTVAVGEPKLAETISEPKQVSFGIVAAPTTEAKPPESVSEPAKEVKVAETVSAPIKVERSSEIVAEPIKEDKITETVSAPRREQQLVETVSAPPKDVRIAETTISPPTKESKLAETVVTPTKEEPKPTQTVPELIRQAKLAEIASVPTLLIEEAENEQSRRAYSVAIATAVAAEAAAAAAQAAAEVVRLATAVIPRVQGKSKEELAAIKIQTMFRGYLARRALRALRGLERLKALIEGSAVKRQATATLRCLQTLARVQSQVHSRRIRMAEENQALQRQLLLKRQKELENLKASMGEDWDDSMQSKEQIEANLIHRQEAAIRRERALAYAFSHQQQWRHSSKSTNPMFLDPNNPQWGWSWLERWMAARPWENRSVVDPSDAAPLRSAARRETNADKPSPVALKPVRTSMGLSPSSPSRPSSVSGRPSLSGRPKLTSPRSDDDSRSTLSMHSQRNRRRSITPSSIRDDESITSASCLPSYMQPTQSARAKSRLNSPPGEMQNTAESTPGTPAKKRLSFPDSGVHSSASSGHRRRLSWPGKVESSL